jgi:MFS family permease
MNPVSFPSEPRQASPSAPAKWRAGTLTYTTGSLAVLFAWLLLGDFSWSMRDRSVGPMAQWYLSQLKVPNFVFGLLISSLPVLVGLLLGPIISVKSDRHRGRWGRRIPFLLVTTPLAALGMIGLALTPMLAHWVHGMFPDQNEMVVAVACFAVFWTAFELATIAGQAVFGGLINDVVPEALLGRFYGLFRAVSLIDGMIFNLWIMGKVPDHFTLILLVIGVFYGTSFMWVCFRVKEGSYAPPSPLPARKESIGRRWWAGVRLYFRECFSSRYYLSVFLMLMIASMAFNPVNIFAIPYARSLGIDMSVYGKFLALTFLISLCLSYGLGWLADLFHPLRVSLVALLGYVFITAWGSLYATTPNSFLTAWVLHGVVSGCYFTSAASLAQRLFPRERFAQFTSAAGIMAAPAGMALAPLVGMAIDQTGNTYRYTFVIGFVLATLALLTTWSVYRQFLRLGGTKGYVAPE